MVFEPYRDVILTIDLPEHGLRAGDVGVAVEHHEAATPGMVEGISVEFFNLTGRTVVVLVLPADVLRAPTPPDRPSTRTSDDLTTSTPLRV